MQQDLTAAVRTSPASKRDSLLDRLMRRWCNRCPNRAGVAELANLANEELRDAARDVCVTASELRVLAGKWPDSADLLSRRMSALGLDETVLVRSHPAVANDLSRLCSLASTRRCANDPAAHPGDRVWERYCPNRPTLASLREQHGRPAERNGNR